MRDAALQAFLICGFAAVLMACAPRDTVGRPALGIVATAEHSRTTRGEPTVTVTIANTAPRPVCIGMVDDPSNIVQLVDSATRDPIVNFFNQGEPIEGGYSVPTYALPAGERAILVAQLDPREYDLRPGRHVRAVAHFLVVDCDNRDAKGGITINDPTARRQGSQLVTSGETKAFVP